MDFAAVNLFLFLYYLRPHEWISMVRSLRIAAFSLVFAIVATFLRERGFTVKDLFRTPHDWAVVTYIAWIIISSGSYFNTWQAVYAYLVYYFVAVQALENVTRIQRFLNWWAVCILIVCVMALLSEIGFDPTGAYDITHDVMKNRLVLGTSIFDNPNALGHGVVPVLIMLYFILVWKRPVFSKIFAIPLIFLPLYCIYLTQSKGAFLSAFAGALVALTFNRPKVIQGLVIFLACTAGWTAMHWLPRMNELDKATSDQAIQGRVAAFKYGLNILHTKPRGLGYEQFQTEFLKVHHYSKAPHSSYVEVGAEFGWIGLALFLSMLCFSFRTLITCTTRNLADERIRRILFTMLVCYTVSSWMVDFAFRASLFLMIAAIGAFHRHLLGLDRKPALAPGTAEETAKLAPFRAARPALVFPLPVPAGAPSSFAMGSAEISGKSPASINVTPVAEEPWQPGILWNRIGVLDVVFVLLITFAWERVWRYLIHTV